MRRFTALLDKFQPRVHSTVLLVKTDTVSVLVKTFSLRRMEIESPYPVPVKWCRHKQGQSPFVLVKVNYPAMGAEEWPSPPLKKSVCSRQQLFSFILKPL